MQQRSAIKRLGGRSDPRHWLAVAVLVIGGAAAVTGAHAQGGPGMGPGPGHGGAMPMAAWPGFAGHGLERMLDGLGVTDAQRAQIRQIAMGAAADLRAQRDAGRALHEKSLQLFAAPTIDAGAAESLRQQEVAQHDAASKRMLQAMIDVGNVLTPEQRAKIAARAQDREAIRRDRMQRDRSERGHPPRQP